MDERFWDNLRRVRVLLADVRSGRAGAERLATALHHLSGSLCHRPGQLLGEDLSVWCERIHACRKWVSFAVETGKRLRTEMRNVRDILAPLFTVQVAMEQEACC